MTIRELRVRALRVPMPEPHRSSGGVISESPLVVTQVFTDQGVVGSSLIFTYSIAALRACAEMISGMEPLIAGDEVAPVAVYEKLLGCFRLLGTQGVVGMAIGAIDMALWDAVARSLKMPLARVLGGVEQPIQAYGAVGFDGPVESARTAEKWAARGFRGVKAKIGYPTVAGDLEVVRAMRSAVGPDVAIMVDYNQLLSPGEAVERGRRLEGEGLGWIEEPVASHDFAGMARVAQELGTPIQAGENWWGPAEVRQAADAGSTDLVMLDVMKIGGVSGWMRSAAVAAAHGVRISSHLWPELSAQLLSVTPGAHWLEHVDWWSAVMREPLRVEGGLAVPGNVDLDDAAVARFET